MNNRLLWDDLHLALAIGATGSLSGAARRLGVSHATVFRRLGQLEERLGVTLFQRQRTGYTPTAAGDAVIATARQMETKVQEIERRVLGQDMKPSGTVRVTTTDTLFQGVLAPLLDGFATTYPEIKLEIAISNLVLNLSKREADIALRPAVSPPETLVGRKLGRIEQAVYTRKELAPAADEDTWQKHDWIGPDERLFYRELDRWMADEDLNDRCRYRLDSVFGMLTAARNGLGLAALPCYLADGEEKLARLCPPIPALSVDLWLLTHPDLRNTARIRAVLDYIAVGVRNSQTLTPPANS